MNISDFTFPLTVDFSDGKYWLNGGGPYQCGEAATAFLAGEINFESASDTLRLTQELEALLKTFGSSLSPYADEREPSDDLFRQLEQNTASCSVGYAFLPLKDSIILTERYTFPTLRDFLYVELGRAILHGNAPRQCRLCGGWFLHKQGDRAIYCERIAPGETKKTCREMGARTVFEKKIQDDVCCKRCISNASNTTDSQLICGTNEMADERKVTNGRVDLYSSRRLLHS